MSGKRGEQNSESVSNQIYTFARTTCFASPSFASRMKAVVVAMLAYVSGVPFPQLQFPLGITSSPHHLSLIDWNCSTNQSQSRIDRMTTCSPHSHNSAAFGCWKPSGWCVDLFSQCFALKVEYIRELSSLPCKSLALWMETLETG